MRGDLLWASIPEMAADAAKRFGAHFDQRETQVMLQVRI